ncbi:MAG TPA: hypothetical protein VN228_14245, partial [Pyrinomonadaceae bacterium]|nr:hypothetical protein [Pyrinomonadaceae bacterium]
MSLLFALTLFVSAALLFWVQPLVGKMLLPLLGGTPAVWNTCLLFFQAALLAGYAYALAVTRWLGTRAQVSLHLALLAAAALAGCGASREEINRGGRIAGTTLNVYSLLPEPGKGAGRDIVDAEKLALYEVRGTAGEYAVNFLSIDEGAPGGRDGARESAVALRDAVADPQVVAVIGPAGSDTGRAAVPLLNAAGILEVLPGAGYPGYTDPLHPGEP